MKTSHDYARKRFLLNLTSEEYHPMIKSVKHKGYLKYLAYKLKKARKVNNIPKRENTPDKLFIEFFKKDIELYEQYKYLKRNDHAEKSN